MVQLSKVQHLRALSLLLFLRAPYVSAVIINVIISEAEEGEVWYENNDDGLRRKDHGQQSMLRCMRYLHGQIYVCRPPPEEPWLGVYAIDPTVTSCEANGGSANWVVRESDWERPEYLPKPPGTVLQIEGPGPAEKATAYAISNTQPKEDYLTFGPSLSMAASEPSKWLVERYGNNNNYETLAPDNGLKVGDTLRFWDPEVPIGFQQLYMHRSKGSPQRFNRLRPLPDNEDTTVEVASAKLRKEYPAAEFRIGSLGNSEIVGPDSTASTSRTRRFLETVGSAKGRIGRLFTGGFRGQPNVGRIGSEEKIPIRKEDPRVRSEEIEIEPGDVFGNPDLLDSMSPDEYLRKQQQQQRAVDLPNIPSLAELALRKSMKKISPVQEIIAQFEESKSDNDNDVRRPVEMERSSKSSHSANSKTNEIGRGRIPTVASMIKEPSEETVYQTAVGDTFDFDEEDRLGDIIDDRGNLMNTVNQPVSNDQAGPWIINPKQLPPSDQSNT
ncbi:hypothetical protein TWF751_009661 [Orbilia oligospora]|nr:hypothetical protein TWF751_009661 [Orbilia oligospora]